MPPKRRNLSPEELLAIAEGLQIALLDGISRTRRWGATELAFQGGTCLHLVYGSPRASEDLDFVLASDKGIDAIMRAALTHANALIRPAAGPNAALEFRARKNDPKTGVPRNPRLYTIAFKSPEYLESVNVRVEFRLADPKVVAGYLSEPVIAKASREALLRRPIRIGIEQSVIPAALLPEILADKIHALAARDYLKPRDAFDLWWISQQSGIDLNDSKSLLAALEHRRTLYPDGLGTQADVAQRLRDRAIEIERPAMVKLLAKDLERWLLLADSPIFKEPAFAQAVARKTAEIANRVAELLAPRARKRGRNPLPSEK